MFSEISDYTLEMGKDIYFINSEKDYQEIICQIVLLQTLSDS